MFAGVGRIDITPPPTIPNGMWMAQRHVRAEGIHQPLWLTALALRQGDEAVVILELDWCLLSDRQDRSLRRAVADACGVPPRRVLPVCTHSHAGPVTQEDYQGEGRDDVRSYVENLAAWGVDATRAAIDRLEPVRIVAGHGRSDIGVNRDLRLPDGRAVAGPNPEGPSDSEVGVVRIESDGGRPVAIVLNYACHPTVLGPDNRQVSPDFPGTAKRVVERELGAPCLFLQGAAGDAGPIEGFVGDPAVAERLGTLLGLEAAKIALGLDARPVKRRLERVIPSGAPLTVWTWEPAEAPPPQLTVRSGHARLPVRAPLPDLFEGAEERYRTWATTLEERRARGASSDALTEAHQNAERERLRAKRAETFRAAGEVKTELQAVALGPVTLLFTWGEPYAQIGLDIKRSAPMPDTFVVGYLGGDPTYVVSPEAFEAPQPFQVENCPFRPEAAALLVEAALDLIHEIENDR